MPLVAATLALVEALVAKFAERPPLVRTLVLVLVSLLLAVAGRCSCVETDVGCVAFIVAVPPCRLVLDCLMENGLRFEKGLHDLHVMEVVIFCAEAH